MFRASFGVLQKVTAVEQNLLILQFYDITNICRHETNISLHFSKNLVDGHLFIAMLI